MGDTLTHGTRTGDLEHGSLCHLNPIVAQDFECGVGWIMLNDADSMLIREYCEVIFCAQMRLILRSLLLTCEGIVFYAQGYKTRLLIVAYRHSSRDLYEVRKRDGILGVSERRITSVKMFSGWKLRKHRKSCVGCCRCVHVYIL